MGSLPKWINIQSVKNINYFNILKETLDQGESSAIALAFECDNPLLILDDLKARKEAQNLGFKVTGVLGILLKCKEMKIIDTIKPLLEQLKNNGFRISPKIESYILEKAQEQ